MMKIRYLGCCIAFLLFSSTASFAQYTDVKSYISGLGRTGESDIIKSGIQKELNKNPQSPNLDKLISEGLKLLNLSAEKIIVIAVKYRKNGIEDECRYTYNSSGKLLVKKKIPRARSKGDSGSYRMLSVGKLLSSDTVYVIDTAVFSREDSILKINFSEDSSSVLFTIKEEKDTYLISKVSKQEKDPVFLKVIISDKDEISRSKKICFISKDLKEELKNIADYKISGNKEEFLKRTTTSMILFLENNYDLNDKSLVNEQSVYSFVKSLY